MSFQAYLDNIEAKTGKTPEEFIHLAHEKGFSNDTKTTEIVSWLKADFGLGHGHAMAMAHVIRMVRASAISMLARAEHIVMSRICCV